MPLLQQAVNSMNSRAVKATPIRATTQAGTASLHNTGNHTLLNSNHTHPNSNHTHTNSNYTEINSRYKMTALHNETRDTLLLDSIWRPTANITQAIRSRVRVPRRPLTLHRGRNYHPHLQGTFLPQMAIITLIVPVHDRTVTTKATVTLSLEEQIQITAIWRLVY
jgi:hypothetical protein